ncbi:MAG: hypothetical protein HKN13_06135, partial [Rhodothermales bacterium]|nr:hypothetical protein [Rhodothermales bacterium]
MRLSICVAFAIAVFICPRTAYSQYDWSEHFGPQETGFEKYWFGEVDLEVRGLRGMIDWKHYSAGVQDSAYATKKIVTKAYRVDRSTEEEQPVYSSFSLLDTGGRQTSTTYLDPRTGKVIQRVAFRYDEHGRLVEWKPVKDPRDVAYAPTAQTIYSGSPPVGRSQS